MDDAARRSPVTYEDVVAAAERLEGVAHRTPVATSRLFDEQTGAQVFFKCENLQRMGAFKMRADGASWRSRRATMRRPSRFRDSYSGLRA